MVKRNSDQIDKIGSLCLARNSPCDLHKKKLSVQSQMQSTVTGLLKLLKCNGGNGHFGKVLNTLAEPPCTRPFQSIWQGL